MVSLKRTPPFVLLEMRPSSDLIKCFSYSDSVVCQQTPAVMGWLLQVCITCSTLFFQDFFSAKKENLILLLKVLQKGVMDQNFIEPLDYVVRSRLPKRDKTINNKSKSTEIKFWTDREASISLHFRKMF